jgi:hypothetical protein
MYSILVARSTIEQTDKTRIHNAFACIQAIPAPPLKLPFILIGNSGGIFCLEQQDNAAGCPSIGGRFSLRFGIAPSRLYALVDRVQ